jgi:hydrogenase-4 component E
MNEIINALFMLVLILNLFALGNGRILTTIKIVAAQGVILGALPLLMHSEPGVPQIAASVATIALKGFIIPSMMAKALRDVQIKREVEPLIGLLPSTVLGALAIGVSFLAFSSSGGEIGPGASLVIPTSISTVIVGFILLTTRFKALSQALGYLVLENGIYIFSLLLVEAIPLVVEMGMLLDLFVSVFIVSIITNHINRAFATLDTRALATLKE